MTAAAALRAAGRWDLNHPRDFDADDWWYRCRFAAPDPETRCRLHFEGLATVADAWLNGTHILRSESMFVATAIDVRGILGADNELVLRFHALGPLLAVRRPRPSWRTGLVVHQQLRWHRTTLLGRIPAWCPPVAPVGPWRPILLESAGSLRVEEADVHVELDGDDGVVRVSILATCAAAHVGEHGTLAVGEWTVPVGVEPSPERDGRPSSDRPRAARSNAGGRTRMASSRCTRCGCRSIADGEAVDHRSRAGGLPDPEGRSRRRWRTVRPRRQWRRRVLPRRVLDSARPRPPRCRSRRLPCRARAPERRGHEHAARRRHHGVRDRRLPRSVR